MDDSSFDEWLAFDSIEPFDPAGTLLAGFSSKSNDTESSGSSGSSWQKQMSTMRLLGELQKVKP